MPKITAFRGATMYELQIGPFWITLLRPSFWVRAYPLVRFGRERD